MSDYVPQDVLIHILAKLPVKTLLRFRSVCKFFLTTISSPSFLSDHINHAKHNCIPLVRYLTGGRISQPKEHYMLLPNRQELDFPFNTKNSYMQFEIVGSCNGLLCLYYTRNYYAGGIILWNPSIKKYMSLPKPQAIPISTSVFGFGFDCKTDDYKVVGIAYSFENGQDMVPMVEIYSLKSGSWKNFNASVSLLYKILPCYRRAFVQGSVHWLGCRTTGISRETLIVSFDMSKDEFETINLPEDLQQLRGEDIVLVVLGGKLVAIGYHRFWALHKFTVWVMEEYGMVESWRKMYDVNKNIRFVGFTNNGVLLLQVQTNGDLVLYVPDAMSITLIENHGHEMQSFHMEMYMESLVLLNKESAADCSYYLETW